MEYSNLLSFSLVENKLERNFKSIVEALLLSDDKAQQTAGRTDQLETRLTQERQKDRAEHDKLKKQVRELQERVTQLEKNGGEEGSQKDATGEEGKQEESEAPPISTPSQASLVQDPPSDVNGLPSPADNKQLEAIMEELTSMKDRMPTLALVED